MVTRTGSLRQGVGRLHPAVPALTVFAAPVLGAALGRLAHVTAPPSGFWSGLILQACLVLGPLAILASGGGWAALGLVRRGAARSIALGALYSAADLALLWLASRMGVHPTHFDEARRLLGLPVVLALYVPFWGVLEALWMTSCLEAVRRLQKSPVLRGWTLVLAGLVFGVDHVLVQAVLYGLPWTAALGYVGVGVLLVVAGTIPLLAKNAWGLVLFWTVSNF